MWCHILPIFTHIALFTCFQPLTPCNTIALIRILNNIELLNLYDASPIVSGISVNILLLLVHYTAVERSMCIGETGTMRQCLAKQTTICSRNHKNDKQIIWSTASTNNKINWHEKWTILLFMLLRSSLLQFISHFQSNIRQDKKCQTFFCRKKYNAIFT